MKFGPDEEYFVDTGDGIESCINIDGIARLLTEKGANCSVEQLNKFEKAITEFVTPSSTELQLSRLKGAFNLARIDLLLRRGK